jgi:hypothetical protein
MYTNRHFPRVIALTAFLGVAALGSQASAAVYTLTFERLNDPSIDVATLTFEDIGSDQVLVTLAHDEDSQGFITDLWMNLDPFTTLTQSSQSPAIKFDGNIQMEEDGFFRAGYDFDLLQEFRTANNNGGAARLRPGESVSFVLTGAGLDAGDLMDTAQTMTGTESDVLAMIRLQGGYRMGGRTNGGNGSGGFIAAAVVPEPATIGVLSLGLIPLLKRRRKLN